MKWICKSKNKKYLRSINLLFKIPTIYFVQNFKISFGCKIFITIYHSWKLSSFSRLHLLLKLKFPCFAFTRKIIIFLSSFSCSSSCRNRMNHPMYELWIPICDSKPWCMLLDYLWFLDSHVLFFHSKTRMIDYN